MIQSLAIGLMLLGGMAANAHEPKGLSTAEGVREALLDAVLPLTRQEIERRLPVEREARLPGRRLSVPAMGPRSIRLDDGELPLSVKAEKPIYFDAPIHTDALVYRR